VQVARKAIRVVASPVVNRVSRAWLNSRRRAAGTEDGVEPAGHQMPGHHLFVSVRPPEPDADFLCDERLDAPD